MKNLNSVFIIIIVSLMGIIAVQTCTLKNDNIKPIIKIEKQKYEIIKHRIDTVFIDKITTKYIKGSDIYHETIIEKEVKVPYHVKDTVKIIQEYYTKNLYKDRLILNDSLGFIDVIDTIQYNKITGRKWNAQIRKSIINNTQYLKEVPHNQLYIGINNVIGNSNNSLLIGPNILLKNKKDNIYGVFIGIDPNLNKYIGFNINWKIKFKKL